MENDPASLSGLHDIELPPDVSIWPLQAGWWILMAAMMAVTLWLIYKGIARWKADAYRREALRELEHTQRLSEINALLRRCALMVESRTKIAELSGADWSDWLASVSDRTPPKVIQELLATGSYQSHESRHDIEDLKYYATNWIRYHRSQKQ